MNQIYSAENFKKLIKEYEAIHNQILEKQEEYHKQFEKVVAQIDNIRMANDFETSPSMELCKDYLKTNSSLARNIFNFLQSPRKKRIHKRVIKNDIPDQNDDDQFIFALD